MKGMKELWVELNITPDKFDLVMVQLNYDEVQGYPGQLSEIKNHPFLQGDGLKAIQCFTESIESLKDGLETDEAFLKMLAALVKNMPDILEDEPSAGSIAEFIMLQGDIDGVLKKPEADLELEKSPVKKKMLGDYLMELGHVQSSQVDSAFEAQRLGLHPGKRLGDILQDTGIISRAQLDEAIEQQMVDSMEV